MNRTKRRYDLDWWRVISIFLVFLHHIGMPFNGDDFHIMNTESSKLLDDIMVFFEQFRLPLLFVISGAGTVFAFSKRSWILFIKERAARLMIPLIFGVFIIVPPQTYIENITSYSSYIYFYQKIFENLNVNHLWFIENLFYLSILCIPIIIWIKSNKSTSFKIVLNKFCSKPFGISLLVIPLILIKVITKQYFPEDNTSITNLSVTLFYGYFFITGIIIAGTKTLWDSLKKYRKYNFAITIIAILLFYAYYFLPNHITSTYWNISTRWNIWYGLTALLSWAIIITLLGYGQIWLNKPSILLKKLNEGIYPFYILHQTIIIIFGYYILQQSWNITVKILILTITSFITIVCFYKFIIYPFRLTRFVFGMKKKPKHSKTITRHPK
ncbi:Peptidoglycan/LPS O-acetylase OafA/YrhL, contains acyltransferase and SGNH-hydrolase domains [Aquimarina amphilecti]|uniref:Peptidoglycan/LPS O-acetylase OafA/YrhL, contains acyltransferase and SGNH-hydrolase domains n=1 Tax=Aquimarina amphilecti TaxID=1038014 RepID=A0A1H7HEY1_AQUAM|nr:acyltransferase [Aquimarina amphilecti]SEK48869.1 Peptidoglycan/LPS O-acetylase OafA/YrhL, contains acyltransferase and SGNH-hydrolase domains [Aquimarina amphilecti]